LYSTEWKVVTYVNLDTVDENFRTVRNRCPPTFAISTSAHFGLLMPDV
jgi:hypothetical protein